jgi:hypothetical protein
MNEFLKFWKKVEQYSSFEGKKIQFGVVEKKLCCPYCFIFYFWVGWTVKYTLSAKFGNPVQNGTELAYLKRSKEKSRAPFQRNLRD